MNSVEPPSSVNVKTIAVSAEMIRSVMTMMFPASGALVRSTLAADMSALEMTVF